MTPALALPGPAELTMIAVIVGFWVVVGVTVLRWIRWYIRKRVAVEVPPGPPK